MEFKGSKTEANLHTAFAGESEARNKYTYYAGMIVDIILNALLIPKMASTGEAIGTLAAEIAVFIVQYVALRGIIKEAYRQVHYFAIGSSVLAGGVLAVLIKRMQWGSFMTLFASAIVFFGVYFLILTIAKESLVIKLPHCILFIKTARTPPAKTELPIAT